MQKGILADCLTSVKSGAYIQQLQATLAEPLDVVALFAESLPDTKEPLGHLALPSPDPSAPAYIMYTSGSTGEPKGTIVPHRGIVRLVRETDYLPFGPDRVFCFHSSMVFDASTFELWGALLNGAHCVVLESDDTELGALGDAIHAYGVDCLWLTSSLFNLVVDECIGILRGVRYLLVGGEDLSVPHVVRALELLPGTQLINGYGPTENTTLTCTYRIPGDLDGGMRHVPIGRPINNTYVYILDHAGQPVPAGCPGELAIGGEGLALGYLNRAGMTSGKFVEDPYRTRNDARVYLSGDRCRWLDSGEIEFLGRTDDQQKVRGFRVEPGETTAVLNGHPSVSAAISLVVARNGDAKQLESWVVAATTAGTSGGELRSFLAGRLPHFNVPWRVNVVDRLPLTNSGKIDRNKLLADRPSETQEDDVMPSTLTDELCRIRDEVLGLGYRGELRVAPTRNAIPPELYTCSLIVGATNVPNVLDVPRLRPGTLIVDDSAPHCFDVRSIYQRLSRDHDLLYTEGGLLKAPFVFERIAYINPESSPEMRQLIQSLFSRSNRNIGGCVMSSLLVQRYHGYEPAIGEIDVARCMLGFDLLSKLGFTAPEPHCNPQRIPPHLITKFIERCGIFTGHTGHEFDRPV